jgi:predicted HTH domain antitoxin
LRNILENVKIRIPRDLMKLLGHKDVEDIERYSKLILAVELYNEGKVSLGIAVDLADVSYDSFFQFLREKGHKIRIGPINLEAEKEYKKAIEHLAS